MTRDLEPDLLVVSDLHLGPQTPDRSAQFLRFLNHAYEKKSEVLILGDLFELWFGWPHLTFEYQKSILSRMEELSASGLQMDYVEGNHDFWISNYRGKLFRTVTAGGLRREWHSRTLYFEHGDRVNRKDWQYLAWRFISKNSVTRFLVTHLPTQLLLSLSGRLEAGMKSTNLKNKLKYPEDECRRFCEKHFQTGNDAIIIGHFHERREAAVQSENKTVLFYNLPGWETGFEYLVIPGSGDKPFFETLKH